MKKIVIIRDLPIIVVAISSLFIAIAITQGRADDQAYYQKREKAVMECAGKISFDPDGKLTTAYYTQCLAQKGIGG